MADSEYEPILEDCEVGSPCSYDGMCRIHRYEAELRLLRKDRERQKQVITTLIAALREMEKAAQEIAVEFIEHKLATNWKIVNDAYCAASDAVRKAEAIDAVMKEKP